MRTCAQLLQGQLLSDAELGRGGVRSQHLELGERGDVGIKQARPPYAPDVEGGDFKHEGCSNEAHSHFEVRDANGQTLAGKGVALSEPFRGVRVVRDDPPASSFQDTWVKEVSTEPEHATFGQVHAGTGQVEQTTAQRRQRRQSEKANGRLNHGRRRDTGSCCSSSEQEWKDEHQWQGRIRSGRCRLCRKWARKCSCLPPRAVCTRQEVGLAEALVHVCLESPVHVCLQCALLAGGWITCVVKARVSRIADLMHCLTLGLFVRAGFAARAREEQRNGCTQFPVATRMVEPS